MKQYTDLELLKLSKPKRAGYKFKLFFASIPGKFKNLFVKIGRFFKNLGLGIVHWFRDIGLTFVHGDWKTKVSYFIMGFGNIARKQVLRGLLFLFFEVIFILYMIYFGGPYLSRLYILGTVESVQDPATGTIVYGENSFNIMLYGVLTLFFIVAFIYTWNLNIKQNRINEEIIKDKKKLASAKDDLRALVDENFHKTLLALPVLGILIFTVLPIFFMILVAFTNYDKEHYPTQPNKALGG